MSIVFRKVFAICLVVILTTLMSPQIHAATIVANPYELNFPDVCPESSVVENVTLTNTSEDPVTLSIWIQGGTWWGFSIISPNPLPDSLEGNGEVTLEIEFTPPHDTQYGDALTVRVNDDDNDIAWIPLYGSGYCPTCTEPEFLCSGACVNTLNNPNHCGGCGIECSEFATCTDGSCQLGCGELTECDDTCVDLSSDPSNCGVCGNICSEYATCTGGICQLDCGELTACDETCVDLFSDPNNCGACGDVCPGADAGTRSCDEGMCVFSGCPVGTIDLSHCYENTGEICAPDVAHFFDSLTYEWGIQAVTNNPADQNRFSHFSDGLRRINEHFLACRPAVCGDLRLRILESDGVDPPRCRGGDECAGSGGVPDAVAGPSTRDLNGLLIQLESNYCPY